MDKEIRQILEAAEAQGYRLKTHKNGHVSVYRDKVFITQFASTPSDRRGTLNALAPLRRDGFVWPPKK